MTTPSPQYRLDVVGRTGEPKMLAFLLAATMALPGDASPEGTTAFVIPVKGTIELGLSAFMARVVEEAVDSGAAGIVVDLDTLGGRVDAAIQMEEALLKAARSGLRTICYVNSKAISAGALVALSCQTIVVAPSSTIGAAEPVMVAPLGATEPVGEKEIAFLRSTFRTAAQSSGHPPLLAEAMVDADVAVWLVEDTDKPGAPEGGKRIVDDAELDKLREKNPELEARHISSPGKLLALTGEEALEVGLAAASAESLAEAAVAGGLDGALLVRTRPTWSEQFARVVTNPAVAGLLLLIGLGALYIEFKIPGFGMPGTVGIICLLLFFLGSYIAGLAQFSDIVLFLLGVALLTVEIFLIPGFGLTGVSGIVLMLVGLTLALVKKPLPQYSWELAALARALYTVGGAVLGTVIIAMALGRYLPETPVWHRIALVRQMRREEGFSAQPAGMETLLGKTGVARTSLRPAGIALIEGRPVDVVTEGEMLEPGTPVKVIQVAGNRVVVERVKEAEA